MTPRSVVLLRADRKLKTGGFAARFWWPDGITRDACDAILPAKKVQGFGRFLGEAHDAARIVAWIHDQRYLRYSELGGSRFPLPDQKLAD